MNKITKYCIIILAANLVFGLLLSIPSMAQNTGSLETALFGLLIFALAQLVQLMVGIMLSTGKSNPEFGQAMLIAVGLIFVIGFSACTLMMNL